MKIFGKCLCFIILCLVATTATQAQSNPGFEHRPDIPHCMLIILNEKWADPIEISGTVVKYNLTKHRLDQLQVSLLRMPYLSNVPVIYVREFRDQQHIISYLQSLENDKPDFMQMNIVDKLVPLSNANYNQILIQKGLTGYQSFYNKHYGNKIK